MELRNHPSGLFLLGFFVAVFLSGQSMAQESADWKDRFYAEAPNRWEEYLRFARSLQMTQTIKGHITDNKGKRSHVLRNEIKQTKGCFLFLDQHSLPEFKEEVEGFNPSYSFKLIRRNPDKGWIIKELVLSDQPPTFSDKQSKFQEKILGYANACLRLVPLPLPTITNNPDFKITRITSQEIDGRSLPRFDFEYHRDYPSVGRWIKGGWMVLDPEHDWILREYLVHQGQPEKSFYHYAFQVREGTDRHPIITRETWQVLSKGEKPYESIGETEWQVVEQSEVPLEEFTLSAFGLPEPPGIKVEQSRLHLWIALGGILCIAIAAIIRWQTRRARAAG